MRNGSVCVAVLLLVLVTGCQENTGSTLSGETTSPAPAETVATPPPAAPVRKPAAVHTVRPPRPVPSPAVAAAKRPAPKPRRTTAAPAPTPRCDAHYPDFCVPPYPPDLDCADFPGQANFTALAPDPHGLDRDHDGLACESN